MAFNNDGTLLASSSLDQTINLWDVSNLSALTRAVPRLLKRLAGHKSWVRGVAFSADGSLLASASADGVAKLWDVETEALLNTLQAHNSAILCIVFSLDNTTFATSGIDGTVRVWHLGDRQIGGNASDWITHRFDWTRTVGQISCVFSSSTHFNEL